MRFHALLPVRDEADIIEQCLGHLLGWADAIYVFDSGSTDETWEIVTHIAATDHRIQLLGKESVYFSDKSVRAWMFNRARTNMCIGDWFLRVDADEIHHVTPPEFVKNCLRPHETVVYHQYYDFRLTRAEVNRWQQGLETLRDRARPIEERRRYFTISEYTEPRLCRYRESMRWPESVSFPFNAGYLARERLPIRHYPHRDPPQLERRCQVRSLMMAEPENACARHWAIGDWQGHIVAEGANHLHYWRPGTALPKASFQNHLASPAKRCVQFLVHRYGVRLIDRLRPGYRSSAHPRPISKGDRS